MATAPIAQSCENCSVPISSGKLCENCLDELISNITHFVLNRLAQGYSRPQIVHKLVGQGMDPSFAERVVTSIEQDVHSNSSGLNPDAASQREAAANDFFWGGVWAIGGLIVTGITYAAADPGGPFLVFWGAVAYGGYRLLRGVARYLSAQ